MSISIVQFAHGSYGIRRRSWSTLWLVPYYWDFKSDQNYWWTKGSKYFLRGDCFSTAQAAKKVFGLMTGKAKKVSLENIS